jgi:RNA polymerase sigma factor (sigma-70 family)
MGSAVLPSDWEDPAGHGAAEDGWAGARQRRGRRPAAAPARPEVPVGHAFDGDAAERLALFAYNVARKFFPCRADLVEEAVQETLTRTCERWERANQRGAIEGWVVNTATYVCQEKLREERRGARMAPAAGVQWDGDDDFASSELLAGALRRLTTRQRLVVVCRYLFDFSVTDTAKVLGLTESKVKDAGHNGVRRLRKMLGDQWSEWA